MGKCKTCKHDPDERWYSGAFAILSHLNSNNPEIYEEAVGAVGIEGIKRAIQKGLIDEHDLELLKRDMPKIEWEGK